LPAVSRLERWVALLKKQARKYTVWEMTLVELEVKIIVAVSKIKKGFLLTKIKETELFREDKFSNFSDYAAYQKTLPFKKAAIYNYMRASTIYKKYKDILIQHGYSEKKRGINCLLAIDTKIRSYKREPDIDYILSVCLEASVRDAKAKQKSDYSASFFSGKTQVVNTKNNEILYDDHVLLSFNEELIKKKSRTYFLFAKKVEALADEFFQHNPLLQRARREDR
jgi:hypothetical protein